MQQILYFFIRNKNFLLFLLLFLVSVGLTINSHSYHKTQFVSSANFLSGGIFSAKSSVTDYFDLKEQNQKLSEENKRLREMLQNSTSTSLRDSMSFRNDFSVMEAKVINNNFSKTKNQLTINKGSNDSIAIDMGVISPQGIVGIVSHLSKNYASVQSVLNTNSQVVAKFKKSNHFGTLVWDGAKPNVVQLKEIPRIAQIAIGDTIVTDGKSTIFPPNILIGTVESFKIDEAKDYYDINVTLFTDMTSVKHIYVISNNYAEEIKQLENEAADVEE
ncbi:MAG: rod shape-determining protein MreC [Alteromonas sp.]|nr:rod shape-determining protein MreC [Alteromonas sp.]